MLLGDMGTFTTEQKNAEASLIKGLKSVKSSSLCNTALNHTVDKNAADNVDFGSEMTLNGSYTWELKVPVPYVARKAYAHRPVRPSFLPGRTLRPRRPDGNNYNPNATQPVRRFQWWGWLSTNRWLYFRQRVCGKFIDPVWQQHLNTQAAA